jgi:hypothetical protein
MITYKLNKGFDGNPASSVNRYDSESTLVLSIPFASDNTDYQAYLAWLELGNQPEPADNPPTE